MEASAWLVIELPNLNSWTDRIAPRIVGVRQTRPDNKMAVHITLDFDDDAFQPHVERMVESGLIQLRIETPGDEDE